MTPTKRLHISDPLLVRFALTCLGVFSVSMLISVHAMANSDSHASNSDMDFFERELTLSAIENADKRPTYFEHLRGFDLDRSADTALFLEGMPINQPTSSEGQGYKNTNFIIFELVDSSLYQRGGFDAKEGDFSSAGSIRMNYATQLDETTLALGLGDSGYQRQLLTGSSGDGQHRWVYGLESVKQDVDQGLSNSSAGNGHDNLVVKYQFGDALAGFNLIAMLHQSDWESDATHYTPEASLQPLLFGSAADNSSRHSLSGAWWRSTSKHRTQINAYLIDYQADLDLNFQFFSNNRLLERTLDRKDSRIISGVNLNHDWFQNNRSVHQMGLQIRRDILKDVANSDITIENRISGDANLDATALFYSHRYQWSDTIRSVTGLRWDQLQLDADDSLTTDFNADKGQQLSPKLSVIFGPWHDTEYFINFGHGIHSNDARYSFRGINTKAAERSNVELTSPLAETQSADIGFSTTLFEPVTVSLSLWQLSTDSELAASRDGAHLRPSKRKGVEVGISYQPNDHIYLAFNGVLSEALFNDGRPDGTHIPGSIEDAAVLTLSYQQARWMTSLYANHYGASPYSEDNSISSDAATALDWISLYQLTPNILLQLELLNLLDDSDNRSDLLFTDRIAAAEAFAEDLYYQPIAPRTLRLQVNFSW